MSWPRVVMLVSLVLAASQARSASPPPQKAVEGPASAPGEVKEQMRQLWHTNAQAPSEGAGSEKLRQAVEKLRAIELSAKARAAGPAGQAAGSQPASAPVQVASQPTTKPAGGPSREADAVAMAKLKGIPTTGVIDLVSLADSLFAAGHIEAAMSFYELALERSTEDQGRDWLLFQAGNCRRETDPSGARAAYKRLIEQYPDSPWKSVASARDRLIEWNQANKPKEFLAELKEQEPPATQPAAVAGLLGPGGAQPR